MNRNYFSNKKVILTGGAGFLGNFVVKKLKERDCKEILIPRRKDCDLTKIEQVRRMYADFKADLVIHMAADVGGIGYNRNNPATIYYNNLMMNTLVQDEAYRAGVQKFTGIGTVCSYPKFTPIPFQEENLWNGYPEETNAYYGLTKKMMGEQSKAYRTQYGFNAIHLLMINLYGPGDNFDLENSHVIPALIRKFSEAVDKNLKEVVLWGDGSPTREFLYAEDAAEAILLATEKYDEEMPLNIGSGTEISIRELANLIASEFSYQGRIIWDTEKPNGQPRRCLDVSNAKDQISFEAKVLFHEGIKRTIRWFTEKNKF